MNHPPPQPPCRRARRRAGALLPELRATTRPARGNHLPPRPAVQDRSNQDTIRQRRRSATIRPPTAAAPAVEVPAAPSRAGVRQYRSAPPLMAQCSHPFQLYAYAAQTCRPRGGGPLAGTAAGGTCYRYPPCRSACRSHIRNLYQLHLTPASCAPTALAPPGARTASGLPYSASASVQAAGYPAPLNASGCATLARTCSFLAALTAAFTPTGSRRRGYHPATRTCRPDGGCSFQVGVAAAGLGAAAAATLTA